MTGAIICGVDDSESAKGAERVARSVARELGVGVIFVRVVEPGPPEAKLNAIVERVERLSGRAGEGVGVRGAAWFVEAAHPADGLVAAASNARASMIVVGCTGPRSSLLGSVSADVSRRAPCPVVVVPPGADAAVNGRAVGSGRDTKAPERVSASAEIDLGRATPDVAGGIARFGGSAQPEGRRRSWIGPTAGRAASRRSP